MVFIPKVEASLLDIPSGTVLEMQVRKPHGASIQVIAVAADGRFKVLHEWNLMVDDLVKQNCKGETLAGVPAGSTVYTRAAWDALKASTETKE